MRRVSGKRAARDREAKPARESLVARVGRCEFCGRHDVWLVAHEILRGSYRVDSQDQPYAQLVLCDGIGDFCHPLMDGRSWAEQLAILRRSRPEDFNLSKFHALAQRKYPSFEAVEMWTKRYSFVTGLDGTTATAYVTEFP